MAFELLEGVVEVVVECAFFYASAAEDFAEELGEGEVVFLFALGVSFGVEFLPSEFGEAGGE